MLYEDKLKELGLIVREVQISMVNKDNKTSIRREYKYFELFGKMN